ncbi:MAG: ATP-binding cassette domain-containing protein [Treponema sp.]|nr:ATP-binding cassette domain-containing protein [Treponema sp.]
MSDMNSTVEEIKIQRGQFVLVLGKSAAGKTTFIKSLYKKYLVEGIKAGYVMQNFDEQIVTDKVWHELCFALENLGTDRLTMQRRVAEVCSYFGISSWLKKDTALLSGGQKQLLNLASVMATTPDVLLLDEPTSQLDPIAAQNFLSTVKKLNTDFGITVIISEHRIEELFALSDRILFFESQKIALDVTPSDFVTHTQYSAFFPVKYRSASALNASDADIELGGADKMAFDGRGESSNAVICRNLSFRYGPKEEEVLSDLNIVIRRGEIFAGVGANGSGKSTFLKLLCGLKKTTAGKIKIAKDASIFLLPQNVKNIFTCRTVRDELLECGWDGVTGAGTSENNFLIDSALLDRHPYDISGGEMQKLALQKILLKKPDIILLDEPTKALDNAFKIEFASILKKLAASGITVILVCHDLDFCEMVADRVSLFFEGQLVGTAGAEEFFAGNNFYTTAKNKLLRKQGSSVFKRDERGEVLK